MADRRHVDQAAHEQSMVLERKRGTPTQHPSMVRIVDAGQVIACHEIPDGKGNQVLDPSHRKARPLAVVLNDLQSSSHPAQRPLDFYDAVGRRLASTSPCYEPPGVTENALCTGRARHGGANDQCAFRETPHQSWRVP